MSRSKSLLCLLLVMGCTAIEYSTDSGFLNSSQANSFEAPVLINGKICKDMDGHVGLCTKQIKSNRPLEIEQPPMVYSYDLVLRCTSALEQSKTYTVEKGKKFSLTISDFKNLKSFQCIGELFPSDRDVEVSAKWSLLVKIADKKYTERETIYRASGHLVLGLHARSSRVCYKNGKCIRYNKKTILRDTRNKIAMAYSESETMRFNYYGY